MPQYLLNIIQPVGEVPPPEDLEPVMRELAALNEEMRAAGAWVFAAALHQPEFIGGFDLIQAEDIDGALAWAGKLARILGGLPVEVRPVAESF